MQTFIFKKSCFVHADQEQYVRRYVCRWLVLLLLQPFTSIKTTNGTTCSHELTNQLHSISLTN